MGFWDLFKKKPPSLANRVNSITIGKMGAAWELVRGQPDHIDMVFCSAIMAGAGEFTRKSSTLFSTFLRRPSPDIIALEAMAFNWFAIRALYPKGHNQNENLLDEGFRLGGMACQDLANARVGLVCKDVFAPRVLDYRRIAKSDGMEAAASHFTRTLFQSDGSKLPQSVYEGSVSPYDLGLGIVSAGVIAFMTTVPAGIAESLNLYLEETNILNETWPEFQS